jgi:hypothetical protein
MSADSAASSPPPLVSVVIPALNEARNLPSVLARIPPDLHEVILVDGGSVDGTVAIARHLRPDVRVVRQSRSGKGNALACGFAVARGDIIAVVDADGSADPGEIPRFVKALVEGADFAKGTRFAFGGGSDDITRIRRFGNRVLTTMLNISYHVKYSDLCYGFNVFWRRHTAVLELDANATLARGGNGRLWGDGFEIETLIHIRVARAGLAVVEVPSYEHARMYGVSNLHAFRDGSRVLATILTEKRRVRRKRASARPRVCRVIEAAGDQPGDSSGTPVLANAELCPFAQAVDTLHAGVRAELPAAQNARPHSPAIASTGECVSPDQDAVLRPTSGSSSAQIAESARRPSQNAVVGRR